MIKKQSDTKEKEQDYTPNIQDKGLNEFIEKVKDMKVKELKRKGKRIQAVRYHLIRIKY